MALITSEFVSFSPTSHSWGGKPIRNPDNKTWSLFAAEMTRHCPPLTRLSFCCTPLSL